MKRIYCATLCAALVLSMTSTVPVVWAKSEDVLKQADHLKNARNFSGAEVLYDAAVRDNPENAKALCGRGVCRVHMGQKDQGLEDLNKAIGLNPKLPQAYASRGLALLQSGETQKALDDFNKAQELGAAPAEVFTYRGICYLNLAQLDLAAQDLKKALDADPTDEQALVNMAALLQKKDEFEPSLLYLDKALAVNPKSGGAYKVQGDYNQDYEQKYQDAVKDYTTAIESIPDYAEAYSARARAYVRLKNWNLALADCNKALSLGAKTAETLNARGNAYTHLNDARKGIEDFDEAIRLDPSDFTIYINRAQAYEAIGEKELAAKDKAKVKELCKK